ncbi:MAG: RNA polymerase sigma factor, partial [Acidimicrobiales bacterium]
MVRRAAGGDEGAFAQLYRAHGKAAWRLAQVVAANRTGSVASVTEGFVRALDRVRQHDAGIAGFGPLVLGEVYRSAAGHTPEPDAGTGGVGGVGGDEAEREEVGGAMRSLPERWRAALWLTDAEGMATDDVATVLRVPAEVATQWAAAGRAAIEEGLDRAAGAGFRVPAGLGAGGPAGLGAGGPAGLGAGGPAGLGAGGPAGLGPLLR